MKVYLATSGEYSDYRVQHVFARREDAEVYALGEDVDERELREGPVEVRHKHTVIWDHGFPERPGDGLFMANPCWWCEDEDFDGREGHVEHSWVEDRLRVSGWDKDRVAKVYSEQRAMRIAAGDLARS